ncbi:MAG: hypothetical protein GX271_07625 [Clostridiales bacterium]|jgi:hypothetical protein|nr:hypothetical protein [Clostridiales bacterium]
MRVVHQINNVDIIEAAGLRRVFERTSMLSGKYKIEYDPSILCMGNNIVKVMLDFNVKGLDDDLINIMIFFPEKKYSLEYIKGESSYKIEFIYEMLVDKEYFNVVILDKYGLLISSTTYVFNHHSIMEYPILKRDYSDVKAESKVIFDKGIIQLVTKKENIDDSKQLVHTWQNVGQHYIYQADKDEDGYISFMNRDKMCAGIWMLIVTDDEGKLITQFVVDID